MKNILSKAKRIDNGEWVKGSILKLKCDNSDSGYVYYIIPEITNGSWCKSNFALKFISPCYEVDHETICQYTGLTDRYGERIWENDVVRYYDDITDTNKEDLVKWNETHASFVRLHKSEMGLQYLYIDECIANRCEVIGNIFDNPELLGEEKI